MALYKKDLTTDNKDSLKQSLTEQNDTKKERFGIDMTQLKKDLTKNKIVDINFAFNNHNLINLLEMRGEAIQKKDYD